MEIMLQLPPTLDGFNEADVREEVIAPLLACLGYRAHSEANIVREQSLRYPRSALGRKNPHRDPPLRGKPDYILEVDGRVRWTIEAKAPTSAISDDDIDQAYSYACHPEVRAVYFCVVNGAEFRVYQTNQGPEAEPLSRVSYRDLRSGIEHLSSLLGPEAVRRDHPRVMVDTGRRVGPGLRSVVRIVSGWIEFRTADPPIPLLAELTLSITDGAIERADTGTLVAYVKVRSPLRSVNELNERLGLNRMEMPSADPVLSTSESSPTVFQQAMQIVMPAGVQFPNLLEPGTITLERNVVCDSLTVATGVLTGSRLSGPFKQRYDYQGLPGFDRLLIEASGQFEAVLG